MLATLVCGSCGDSVATSARSAVLPFTCETCQRAAENFAQDMKTLTEAEAVKHELDFGDCDTCNPEHFVPEVDAAAEQFYEDMAPASSLPRTASGFSSEGYLNTEPDVTEEFATVDNTTLLIEDLEKQLSNAEQGLADYFQRSVTQGDTIFCLQEQVRNQSCLIDVYQKRQYELLEMAGNAVSCAIELSDEAHTLQERLNAADSKIYLLKADVESFQARRDFWRWEAIWSIGS